MAQTDTGPAAARLLPEEAYPEGLDGPGRDRLDESLRQRVADGGVPSEPGVWLDREGDPWVLGADGSWTDASGETRGASWAPVTALFGPWTRAPEERSSP